jgi:hypothetical protein
VSLEGREELGLSNGIEKESNKIGALEGVMA